MITPTQWFQGTVWILALIGLVFRYSVTGQMAADPGMALLKELAYFAAALGGFHLCGRISRENLQRWGRPMVLAAIGVLVLMVLGLSARANGASRWIDLGFMRFQPGELIKVVLVIYMADYLTRHGREVGEWKRGFLPAVGVMGTLFLLVVMQPDFGTALILFTIGAWMMLMAGSKLKHFSVLALAGLPALVLLILSAPYRLQRVMAWFNPHEDLRGSAYQVNQAKWAIAQGGLLGRGLLGGDARLGYLPECENDFIAAVWIRS
ncbi:MAG: FtsW/RodA/SpoVE family cell cycle protein, partial [Planctomycetota bacterium]